VKRVIIPVSAIAAFSLATSSFATTTTDTVSLTAFKKLEREVATLRAQVNQKKNTKKIKHAKKMQHKYSVEAVKTSAPGAFKNPWAHFVTVTTTPFLGRGTDYDGDDLLFNLSSNNEDLRLLKQKQQLDNEMKADGYSLDRPVLQLSGAVEAQGYSYSGFSPGTTTSGLSLSTAELDFNAIASSWASAFMSTEFNGAPISTGNRAPNSTIYLSRGFATIGNLNRFPVYFTGGLMYVPFGRYANDMVSTPLTQSLGRIRTPAALLGFSLDNGLHGSVYGYSGSQTSGAQPVFKQWGADANYKYKFGTKNHISFGGGWVSNIADAQGQQNTGLSTAMSQFGGFGVANAGTGLSNNNALVHAVDAADGHATVAFDRISLIGEYLSAIERYNTADMTFNSVGAEPAAAHAEVDYLLPFFDRKYGTTLGLAYGHTSQALALNLPENSYSVFVNTSIWRETTESLEFRHDTDYSNTTTASGRGATANIVGTGRTRNSVLAQVGVYF